MNSYRKISHDALLMALGGFETPASEQRGRQFLSNADIRLLFNDTLTDAQIEERIGIRNARSYRYYWSAA